MVIWVIDKDAYEKYISTYSIGRKIEVTPFIFLLSGGTDIPKLDVLSTKQITMSPDNKVMGFYGTTRFEDVLVNGQLQDEIYNDYYRLYTMNNGYIYQIVINYIPRSDAPRNMWNNLIKHLKSLRIVQ